MTSGLVESYRDPPRSKAVNANGHLSPKSIGDPAADAALTGHRTRHRWPRHEECRIAGHTISKCGLFVDVCLKEPGEAVKIAIGINVANHRDQRFRVDQVFKRFVMEFQLPADADHHPIKFLFG